MSTLEYQIVILWLLYPIGIMLHTLIALLPLFAGEGVKEEGMDKHSLPAQQAAMMVTSSIPLIFIAAILFADHIFLRWLNLAFACLLSAANFLHLLKHMRLEKADMSQIILLALIFVFSLLLAFVSYQWCIAQ